MAFDLGAFAGGIGQGIEQGQDIRRRYQEQVAKQQLLKAQAAAAQAQIQGQQGAAQLQQGGQPMPQGQGGPPTAVPMPGATPMPGPQQQPQMTAPAPPPRLPTAAAPSMGGPVPSAPAASPPQGGPQASGGQGGQGQMDPATMQVHQQTGNTLQGLYKQVLAANPGLKSNPLGAYQAVEAMITQNKEADDSEKTLLTAYNNVMKLQLQAKEAEMKATQAADETARKRQADQDKRETALAKIAEAYKAAQLAAQSRQAVASTAAGARIGSAQIGAESRERVGAGHDATSAANANLAATIKQYGIDAGMSEAEMKAAVGEETSNYRAEASAAAQSGKPAPAKPGSRATLKRPLQPSLGNSNVPAGTARNPYKASSPEEVKAAKAAGKIKSGDYVQTPQGQLIQVH